MSRFELTVNIFLTGLPQTIERKTYIFYKRSFFTCTYVMSAVQCIELITIGIRANALPLNYPQVLIEITIVFLD